MGRLAIEVTGGFIRQNEIRIIGKRTGNSRRVVVDRLTIAAACGLPGPSIRPTQPSADVISENDLSRGIEPWHQTLSNTLEIGYQVVGLKDKPNGTAPPRKLLIGQPVTSSPFKR